MIMRSFIDKTLLSVACLLAAVAHHAVCAAPYVPKSDDTVVETVRAGAGRAARSQWRQASGPDKGRAALAYARTAIDQARKEGDPRWLGAAQAALGPWWAQPAPPPPARLLRATILQSLHDFNASLKDLDALVDDARTPEATRLQARFTRASVLQVQGRWRDAAQDCQALAAHVPLESAACLAELRSLAGDAASAQTSLRGLAQKTQGPQQAWLNLMQAELAERMGQRTHAEALYQKALQTSPDSYTLGAYADLLLDAGRPAEVERLLQGHQQVDGLLLRLAMAWQRMGPDRAPRLQQAINTLQANFDAARVRGERVHMREEARFELALKHRPQVALGLAQSNWAVQKEPADARVLMEAARAASQSPVQRQLADWLQQQGLSDARLSGSAS